MKTLSLNPAVWLRSLFTAPGVKRKQVNKVVKPLVKEESAEFLNQLQRKAYMGNFFVGPYILFNPDLFRNSK